MRVLVVAEAASRLSLALHVCEELFLECYLPSEFFVALVHLIEGVSVGLAGNVLGLPEGMPLFSRGSPRSQSASSSIITRHRTVGTPTAICQPSPILLHSLTMKRISVWTPAMITDLFS